MIILDAEQGSDVNYCSVDGCSSPVHGRGLCNKHRLRLSVYGRLHNIRRERGTGTVTKYGHVRMAKNGVQKMQHVSIAEEALGRELPDGVVVHHADCNPSNNTPSNLVICPSQAYHFLLHRRINAINECGNPDYRKCYICKEYDPADVLFITNRDETYHRACKAKYELSRKS